MKFKLFGTEIYISFLFAAVVSLCFAMDRTGLMLPTFLSVLLHETGHLLVMKQTGCAPSAIRLIPASVQIIRPFCKKPRDEVLIALAGPLCNFVSSILFGLFWLWVRVDAVLRISLINLILGVFNLLPVTGLDGAALLYALLTKRFSPERAVFFLRTLTFIFSGAALLLGVLLALRGRLNPSFFILALYFLLAALLKI